MKKTVVAVAVSLTASLVLLALGGYSVVYAESRKIPVYKVQTEEKILSISFDAAWGADKTQKILDVCDEYGVKATFFLVGFWVEKFPEMVKEIDRRGHEIGTHSDTHPKMSTLSAEKITTELQTSVQKIETLIGKKVELFRPPFGDYDNKTITCAENLGLYSIQWSVDSLDWKGISARQIAERVQKADRGDVVLCHNNSDHIVEALPAIFAAAQNKGLSFVPIGQLIYREGFKIDNTGKQIPLN